jgi:hypothetical protein
MTAEQSVRRIHCLDADAGRGALAEYRKKLIEVALPLEARRSGRRPWRG